MIEFLAGLAVSLLVLVIALQIRAMKQRGADPSVLYGRLDVIEKGQERSDRLLREEVSLNREETGRQARSLREEMGGLLQGMRTVIDDKLAQIQGDNAKRLEEIRATVDEKLQGTLEKRLGESFQQVSERLEKVHQGLGEMKSLAGHVGDLKNVLTNVKVRGTWGEIQLGSLLEQVLSPEQFAKNVCTREGSLERVEFAIKLPGREGGSVVWLPVDAKFPKEDYERLVEASERADLGAVEEASKAVERALRTAAKDIRDKYLNPPNTTDFGIMFLPSEGLYAEALRRVGLVEVLQREYRVCLAGPTTIVALLNSLQLGFRTLAIEKRASEVWKLLGAVKTEFAKFGSMIEKVQNRIEEANRAIGDAATRTRQIERKLRDVEQLPAEEAQGVLPQPTERPSSR